MRNNRRRNNKKNKPVVVVRRENRQTKKSYPAISGVFKYGSNAYQTMGKRNDSIYKQSARELNDVPLGTSQRNGFNKNSGFKIVTKDEYIGEIAGSILYTVTQYPVNPGQAITFPWLSIEALQWEKYEFLQLEFYLKPEVTQYTTSADSGKVILSFDSDASDAAPATKQQAEDTFPMCDGMPYQTQALVIPKSILKSKTSAFYVRTGNLPGGADIKTYDLGNLFISSIGQGDAVPSMMELRVRYTCKLMIPVLENKNSAPRNFTVSQFNDAKIGNGPGAYGVIFPNMGGVGILLTDGLGWDARNAYGVFTPPVGNYIIHVDASCISSNNVQIFEINAKYQNVIMGTNPTNQINLTTNLQLQVSLHQTYWLTFNGTTDTFQVVLYATILSGGSWNSLCTLTIQSC
jgi:hypothetical protein